MRGLRRALRRGSGHVLLRSRPGLARLLPRHGGAQHRDGRRPRPGRRPARLFELARRGRAAAAPLGVERGLRLRRRRARRLPEARRIPSLHRRRVLFVKPRYWVVVDDLVGRPSTRSSLRFQFAPLPVSWTATGPGRGWRGRPRSAGPRVLAPAAQRELHERRAVPSRAGSRPTTGAAAGARCWSTRPPAAAAARWSRCSSRSTDAEAAPAGACSASADGVRALIVRGDRRADRDRRRARPECALTCAASPASSASTRASAVDPAARRAHARRAAPPRPDGDGPLDARPGGPRPSPPVHRRPRRAARSRWPNEDGASGSSSTARSTTTPTLRPRARGARPPLPHAAATPRRSSTSTRRRASAASSGSSGMFAFAHLGPPARAGCCSRAIASASSRSTTR